jgi:hypothetical protein
MRNIKSDWAIVDPNLYKILNDRYGFDYNPSPHHTGGDTLNSNWGKNNFICPPFNQVLKNLFVNKAIKVAKSGHEVAMLMPTICHTKFFHETIKPNAKKIQYFQGQKSFTIAGKVKKRALMLVILKTPQNYFAENYEFMKIGSLITHNSHIEILSENLRRMLASSKKGLNVRVTNAVRTARQNNALHGTLSEYATKLNDAGIPYKIIIGKKEIEGIWTLENLKALFRIIAQHLYGTQSTAKLSTAQMSECYQVFAERISFNTGVHVDWHSNEPPDL